MRVGKPELIVALDVSTTSEASDLAQALIPEVNFFKVGLTLFCSRGPEAVSALKSIGARVFLDLKLHDIPAQVKETSRALGAYGVDMLTVHCLGGVKMMSAAKQGVREGAEITGHRPPLVVGVTVLTSLETPDLEAMGLSGPVERTVCVLAAMAKDAGLDGVVASGRELRAIRSEIEGPFKVVTPGIRPSWANESADQKRTLSPRAAAAAGADFLVVGRPIIEAADPRAAALKVLVEIES